MKRQQVAGCIDHWHAERGVYSVGGYVTEWIGARGHVWRPITGDMVMETSRFSGSRRAIGFNGTSQGMRCTITELAATNHSLAFVVQLVAASDPAGSVCLLSHTNGLLRTPSYYRLSLMHNGAGTLIAEGAGNAVSVSDNAAWVTTEERVWGASRVAGGTIELFSQGASLTSDTDSTATLPLIGSSLVLGHDPGGGTAASFFSGSIRSVSIYSVGKTEAEMAALYAQLYGA